MLNVYFLNPNAIQKRDYRAGLKVIETSRLRSSQTSVGHPKSNWLTLLSHTSYTTVLSDRFLSSSNSIGLGILLFCLSR